MGIGFEFFYASCTAEVVLLSFMLVAVLGRSGIDIHAADRVTHEGCSRRFRGRGGHSQRDEARRRFVEILLRMGQELVGAAATAEKVLPSGMFGGVFRRGGIDVHPADGVASEG